MFCAIAALAEQAPTLVLTGPTAENSLGGYYDVYLDEDWSKTIEALAGPEAEVFERHPSRDPDYGYTDALIWLRLTLRNDSPTETDWRLYLHENFKHVFDIWVDRDGNLEQILALDRNSSFHDRPVKFPEMVAPLKLDKGETATIYMAYWSEGSSYLSLSVETIASFTEIAARKSARNFIFYGMMLLLIIAAIVALVILRSSIFFAYAAYAASALIYVMHADGVTYQYLWPSAPGFNGMASIFAGSALIMFGANYARAFLKTAQLNPITDRLLLGVIFVTLALNAFLLIPDPQLLKKLLVVLSLIAVILFAGAGLIAALTRFREVRFYLLAWVGAVLSATLLNLRHLFGLEISQDAVHDSIRAVMVFDAAMMGLAIADRYNQLRLSRQDALQNSLAQAERNLNLNRRLSELEERYTLAKQIAHTQSEQIQNTVHDLRQPLHALRLNVENQIRQAASGNKPAHSDTIESTLTYLENLISEQLQQSTTAKPTPTRPEVPEAPLGVAQVLRSILDMFASDAKDKGLESRGHLREVSSTVPPLVLMRIVSNLISNAIKYTETGGVLLGVRDHGDAVRIEVHDTGAGMSPEAFAQAQQRAVRLRETAESVEGHGLGLAIAMSLCDEHGLTLSLSDLRRTGTGVVLTLPKPL